MVVHSARLGWRKCWGKGRGEHGVNTNGWGVDPFTVRSHIGPQLWRCAMKSFCQKINGDVLELEVATESSIYDVKVSAMPMAE